MDKQPRIFISYSRVDQEFALRLATALKTGGFNIWLDQLHIPTGEHWDDEVEKALVKCEIFMILMTSASMASVNVKDEIGYAIDRKKEIVPILLEECNVPLRLSRLQYVDLKGGTFVTGVQLVTQRLKEAIADLQHQAYPSESDWKAKIGPQSFDSQRAEREAKISPQRAPSPTGMRTVVDAPPRKNSASGLVFIFLLVFGFITICGWICIFSDALASLNPFGYAPTSFAVFGYTPTSRPIPNISGNYTSSLTGSCASTSYLITITATSNGYTMDWYSIPNYTLKYSNSASFDGQTLEFPTSDASGNVINETYTLNADGSFSSAVRELPCGLTREIFTPVR